MICETKLFWILITSYTTRNFIRISLGFLSELCKQLFHNFEMSYLQSLWISWAILHRFNEKFCWILSEILSKLLDNLCLKSHKNFSWIHLDFHEDYLNRIPWGMLHISTINSLWIPRRVLSEFVERFSPNSLHFPRGDLIKLEKQLSSNSKINLLQISENLPKRNKNLK